MNYLEASLRQVIAKMLPSVVFCVESIAQLHWHNENKPVSTRWPKVLSAELLHLCWLVEEELTENEWSDYTLELIPLKGRYESGFIMSEKSLTHATWQQRVIALAQVKGIEIV